MKEISMRQLLEAGVHFGHQTRFWHPKMAPFIFGERNRIHIINLERTVPLLQDAVNYVSGLAARGGMVLFVGTKRAAREAIKEQASRCGMPFVNHRWLGGMMTNFRTVKQSVRRMKQMEQQLADPSSGRLTKKEQLLMRRELDKLDRSIGGIRDMERLPDALFVIDVMAESIAIAEAKKLGIPVVAVVDTNCSPELVDYPIPGNDDSIRAIQVFAEIMAEAVLDGRGSSATGGGSEEFVELVELA